MPWTDAEAKARLENMVAWQADPALTASQVDDLLAQAKRVDAYGLEPDDADWTPTYDLNAAAAEGWRWKAAVASGRFDLSDGGDSMSRSQVVEHCLEQADRYERKVTSSVRTTGPWSGTTVHTPVIGNLG